VKSPQRRRLTARLLGDRSRGPVPHSRRLRLLRQTPFSCLPEAVLAALARELHEERVKPGTDLAIEGDAAETVFLIVSGVARVSVEGLNGRERLAEFGPGELIGAVALLVPDRRHIATVTAELPVRALALPAGRVERLMGEHPALHDALEENTDTLVRARFIKRATPFSSMSVERSRWLATRLEPVSVPSGTEILRQGEEGDACYLVRRGRVEVYQTSNVGERRLASLGPGMLFGEAALLTASPRNASVRASEPVELWALRRDDLLEAMAADKKVGEQIMDLLRLRDRPRQSPEVIAELRPSLVRGVDFPEAILKHPGLRAYYRLSAEGWFVWQLLDGHRTLRDLTMEYLAAFRVFAPDAVAELIADLASAGFVEGCAPSEEVLETTFRQSTWQRAVQKAQRFAGTRLEVPNADTHVTRLYRLGVRLLYTPPGYTILAATAIGGLVAFLLGLQRAVQTVQQPGGLYLLTAAVPAYLLGILVHEAGHAFTTKRFGREILGIGILWFGMAPAAYVDTSDMWLAGRWPRVWVSLAGPFANLVLAGVFALMSWNSEHLQLAACLWIAALVSLVIVFINLDPLLEYDGYFMLMDLTERPNLRRNALAWLGGELAGGLRSLQGFRQRLRGHGVYLGYSVAAVLYTLWMCLNTLWGGRVFMEGWFQRVLPGASANLVAWLLAALVAAASLRGVMHELKAGVKDR
jgi:putative peptide zinc metalloprotease protein